MVTAAKNITHHRESDPSICEQYNTPDPDCQCARCYHCLSLLDSPEDECHNKCGAPEHIPANEY